MRRFVPLWDARGVSQLTLDEAIQGMRFMRNLLDAFSHDVEIELSKELVVFRCAGRSVSYAPVVHLSAAVPRRVVAVGDGAGLSEPCIRVELFSPNSQPPADVSKEECLEGFFRYAITKVGSTRDLVRPRMIIVGVDNLADLFCGYERWLFRDITERSGARECEFRS